MSAYALRQFSLTVVEGAQTSMIDAMGSVPLYQSVDVNPRMVLKLGDGDYGGYMTPIAAGGNHTVELPVDYVSTARLFVVLKSSVTVKVIITSPDHPLATLLVSVVGTDPGVLSWCGTVTSIVVSVPGAVATDMEFVCWTLPDINSSSGWRQGEQSTGVQDAD